MIVGQKRYGVARCGAAVVWSLVLWATSIAAGAQNALDSLTVNVDPGTSREKNVGCGFDLVTKEATRLEIHLTSSKGTIVKSDVVSAPGGTTWQRINNSETDWYFDGVAPDTRFWCIIKCTLTYPPGGGGEPVRWMSVSYVDFDADADNDNIQSAHRSPSRSSDEDSMEYPGVLTSTEKGHGMKEPPADRVGLVVPINDNNSVNWNRRDWGPPLDYDADEEYVLDAVLEVNPRKAGAWGDVNFFDLALYTSDGTATDHADRRLAIDQDVVMPLRLETYSWAASGKRYSGRAYFEPDTPSFGLSARDEIKYITLGCDIDVDSDNSGTDDAAIESSNAIPWNEDFYEACPSASCPSEYEHGMIVGVNDNDDNGNGSPDNGWNGRNWSGPDANTVENVNRLRPGILRGLRVNSSDKPLLDTLAPVLRLRKVSGDGAVRLFTTSGHSVIGTFGVSASELPVDGFGGTANYERLYHDDLSFRVEGLRPGEVVLRYELLLNGKVVHHDDVRITVLTIEFVNPRDIDGDGRINDPEEDNGGKGTEFTFWDPEHRYRGSRTRNVGQLRIDSEANILPHALESVFSDDLRWQVFNGTDASDHGAVFAPNDTTRHWSWAAGLEGKGRTPRFTITGIPPHNSDFGRKTVRLRLMNSAGTKVLIERTIGIEVFWPLLVFPGIGRTDGNFAKNHPGDDLNSTADENNGRGPGERAPNWFYYWSQVIPNTSHARYAGQKLINHALGIAPAIRWFAQGYALRHDRILIGQTAQDTHHEPLTGMLVATGIDSFARTVEHENYHAIDQSVGYTNAAFGMTITGATNVADSHWSFNIQKPSSTPTPPLPPGRVYNHYVDLNGDGDFTDAGEDLAHIYADHDVPDSKGPGTVEGLAEYAESSAENAHASDDWGNPGKNHKTSNHND